MILTVTQDEMRKEALKWIDPNERLIIELGCSSGNFAELLLNKGIKNYLGVDILPDKIFEALRKFPKMHFLCCDICKNLGVLKEASLFVSFQCLEHIIEDLKILNSLNEGTRVIISVPNSPYKGHVRYFEVVGWKKRFERYLIIDKVITIQNPKKEKKRAFLFRGIRNGYKD